MLPHALVLLLLASLAVAQEDYIREGDLVSQTLDLHLGLLPRAHTTRDDAGRDARESWSYVSAPRQRRLFRILPSGDTIVQFIFALCDLHDSQRYVDNDLVHHWLRSGSMHSEIHLHLYAAQPGESLSTVEDRIRSGEPLYDSDWRPVHPHLLSIEGDGWGTWEGTLEHGGVLVLDVTESWVEYPDEANEPSEARFNESPIDAHFYLEIERLGKISRRADQAFFNSSAPFSFPVVGDTTASQAILLSPPFAPPPTPEQQGLSTTYPNYSLPLVNPTMEQLQAPSNQSMPPWRLEIEHTVQFDKRNRWPVAARSLASKTRGSCIARRAISTRQQPGPTFSSKVSGVTANVSTILHGLDGWRLQWIVEGLPQGANFTAYISTPDAQLGPIYFRTKQAGFPCQLVHSLPYCPAVAYSVPIVAPPNGLTTYTVNSLPSTLTDPLLSVLRNFSISLGTFSCGHDWWSPVQTCSSCFEAYRNWACNVWFPRCGEGTQDAPSPTSSLAPDSTIRSAALTSIAAGSTPRTPSGALPPIGQPYEQLLPCVEICQAADRACPPFIGFKCPVVRVNANQSYGVGYVDFVRGPGASYNLPDEETRRLKKLGDDALRGLEADRYGNRWCAGDVLDFAGTMY